MKGVCLWGSLFKKETFLNAVAETEPWLFNCDTASERRWHGAVGMADGDLTAFGNHKETSRTRVGDLFASNQRWEWRRRRPGFSSIRFSELIESYWPLYVANQNMRPGTLDAYAAMMGKWISPAPGDTHSPARQRIPHVPSYRSFVDQQRNREHETIAGTTGARQRSDHRRRVHARG